jgi:ketosteroid isomerase-like protein
VPWLPLVAAMVAVLLTAGCARAAPCPCATGPAAPAVPATRASADAAPLPSVPLPAELERVLRDYEVAWTARSPDALARLFTEDGFVLEPGRSPARGHDEILRAYTGAGGSLALRALAYAIDGNTGYIVGAFSGAVDKPDIGKFILLVRREPGGPWKIAADMDNGNPHGPVVVRPSPQ